jgi:hypothetical protein
MWHVIERLEMHKRIWCGNLKEGDCLEDLDIEGRIKLKWFLK